MEIDYSDEELKQMSVKTLNRLLGSGIYSGDEYKLISSILTEKRMIKKHKKSKKDTFYYKIFTYLERHPNATVHDLTNIFDCRSFVAEQYLNRWNREMKMVEELKQISQRMQQYIITNNSLQERIKNLENIDNYLQKENRNLENDKLFLQEQLRTSILSKQSWFSKLFKFGSKAKNADLIAINKTKPKQKVRRKTTTSKEKICYYMRKHPDATTSEVRKAVGCKLSSAKKYRSLWLKNEGTVRTNG
jgi:hypothetical protein